MTRTVTCSTAARYTVSELSAFGQVRIAAEFEAENDGEALRLARRLVPHGSGELRQDMRIVCRFGRA
nr:hypothetical protein [uncultured Sphingomonas sp.]